MVQRRNHEEQRGWFVGSERGGMGLSGTNRNAFGNFGSLYAEGAQFGYSLKKTSGLPVAVYAGFDTLKYDTGIGSPFAPFGSMFGTLPGYSAHAGIQPTSRSASVTSNSPGPGVSTATSIRPCCPASLRLLSAAAADANLG